MSDAPEQKQKIGYRRLLVTALTTLAVLSLLAWATAPTICRASPCARAFSEIKGIDLAAAKICADGGVASLRELFTDFNALDEGTLQQVLEQHTIVIYNLLRKGRTADLPLKPECRARLGDGYIPLGKDPWGHLYTFYVPATSAAVKPPVETLLRSAYLVKPDPAIPGSGTTRKTYNLLSVCAGPDGRLELLASPKGLRDEPDAMSMRDDITNLREYPLQPE